MPDHALLVLPSANRVYSGDAPRLVAAELTALDELALGGRLTDVTVEQLGGVAYVTFGLCPLRARRRPPAAAADTRTAVEHLGKGSVDVIVTDLPCGVQHGSTTGSSRRRSPLDLLTAALPVWRSVLRPGAPWRSRGTPRCWRGTT